MDGLAQCMFWQSNQKSQGALLCARTMRESRMKIWTHLVAPEGRRTTTEGARLRAEIEGRPDHIRTLVSARQWP